MSCPSCQNDNCNGCTEKFCTSDINCIQSNFQNLNIPAGSTLTEVLELLEQYVNSQVNNLQNISITLGGDAACIGLAAGTYSYAQVFNAIITTLCTLVNATPLDTDTLPVGAGITLPSCLSGFVGTTTSELLEYIGGVLCSLTGRTPISGTQPYEGSNDADMLVALGIVRDVVKGIADNQSYVVEHTTPSTDPNALNIDIQPLTAVVNYYPVKRTAVENITFSGNKDVYVFLGDRAEISVKQQTIGDPEPSVPSKMLMYKIVTSGTGVSSLTERFDTGAVNPTPLSIPSAYIEDSMIKTNEVDSNKLIDSGVVAGTYGQTQFLQFTVNAKGIVTAASANFHLTGLANGDIIYYNAANLRFENKPNLNTGTVGYFPVSTGSNFSDSSLRELPSDIITNKNFQAAKIEGVGPLGSTSYLTTDPAVVVNGGPLFFVPMSAADASSITPYDGMMVYVNTTDVTFTSVGFWGYENGAWVKL